MTPDELLTRVAAQPVVAWEGFRNVLGPTLSALLSAKKQMLVSELMAHPDMQKVPHTFRCGHLVGPRLRLSDIQAWQENWRSHRLPTDMAELLTRANGIHLWADIEGTGRSYEGILPLEEWRDVNETSWAEIVFQSRPDGHLAISYHADGDAYLALDTRGPRYLYCDLYETKPEIIGSTVSELLDWWWNHCACLDPRLEGG